ncbi:hypothetical protein K523DRAFT_355180 [Schizophyllum commune Tattone D]|nr:hypothetical protein K523DRAFT_355180 [Schizophyllum commune Tattone D]
MPHYYMQLSTVSTTWLCRSHTLHSSLDLVKLYDSHESTLPSLSRPLFCAVRAFLQRARTRHPAFLLTPLSSAPLRWAQATTLASLLGQSHRLRPGHSRQYPRCTTYTGAYFDPYSCFGFEDQNLASCGATAFTFTEQRIHDGQTATNAGLRNLLYQKVAPEAQQRIQY